MKSLTNVIIKNSHRGIQFKSKREILLAALAFIIVFGFFSGMMISGSYTITTRLAEINQTYTFTNILLLFNFFILFGKSIFESLNVLYFSKDLRILLRMPIKSKNILHSKFINMIISEYQMEFIMLAIPMITYGVITKASWIFYLYMIIILLILPVIPILLTSLVIAIIMRFTNKIKNKNKVLYITVILTTLLVGGVTSIFSSQGEFSVSVFRNIVLQANGVAETIAEYFVLIKPIMNTLLNYDNIEGLKNLVLYLIENIICYVLVLNIISKIYFKGAIGASINSTKRKDLESKEIKINDFKENKKNKSYLIKEWKTLLRAPIFCIQCIIMPIAYPITMYLTVLGLVAFAELVGLDLWVKLNEIASSINGYALFLIVGQTFNMMNFTSIIAISRESKNAMLLKHIPIELDKQFKMKISLGILVNMVGTLIVTWFYYQCTNNILTTVVLLANLVLINIMGEKFKLLIDLKKPQLNWETEYTMMKQNTNIMNELFYTFMLAGIFFGIAYLVKDVQIFMGIILVILLVFNILVNKYVRKNSYDIFGKIY